MCYQSGHLPLNMNAKACHTEGNTQVLLLKPTFTAVKSSFVVRYDLQ